MELQSDKRCDGGGRTTMTDRSAPRVLMAVMENAERIDSAVPLIDMPQLPQEQIKDAMVQTKRDVARHIL